MSQKRDSEIITLRTILQEPDARKARSQFLKAIDREEFDDQAIYDQIEHLVFGALICSDPFIEIYTRLAQIMLLMLKAGINRPRGGQKNPTYKVWQKRTLVGMALREKQRLIKNGENATQAHLAAAEYAAEEGNKRGIKYKPGYLEREMQKREA